MTFKAFTLAALAAATTFAGAGAASAQDFRGFGGWGYGPPPRPVQVDYRFGGGFGFGGDELRGREDRLQGRLDQEARNGAISPWRAYHAQGDLAAVRRDQHDLWLRQGGLYPRQVAWLNSRLDRVGGELNDGFGGFPPPAPRW